MIGPLAEFVTASNLFKIAPKYFGKVLRKSNVCILRFDWLIVLYIFMSLVCNVSFLIVKTIVLGKKSVMSTNHCARTYFWWVSACEPHLWFVHLPYWHFSLHLPPLQRPGMCTVYNFECLKIFSHSASSQESIKHKSTFTFTFTLCTIYEVNDTATWVLGVVFFNLFSSHLTPFPPHSTHPSLSLFVWVSLNSFSFHFLFVWSIHPSMDRSIDPFIHPSVIQSIYPLIDLSINISINWSINQCIDWSIHQSIEPSIHRYIDQFINPSILLSINPSINWSIDPSINTPIHQLIHRSIHRSIDSLIHKSFDWSIHPSLNRSIHWSINQ